ncbi:MAG: M28 family peptidase [Acidobacteria bacterium]|nr:M28 family peptidase [Acidobacteriota bacterium]
MLRRIATWSVLLLVCGTAFGAARPALVRVERRAPDDLARLRAADLPVVMEMDRCLFLRAESGDLGWLDEHGYEARVLDSDASRSDFVVVGLRPDSDRAAVEALGAVLLAEDNWVLLRVPRSTSLELLHPARVFATRLPVSPVAPPKAAPPAAPPPPAVGPDLLPDPLVQQMVNSVSPTQIDQFWTDLTTNAPTGTRYSTSQGCRDAAAYCFAKYGAYKLPAAYQNWSTSHAPNVIGTHDGAIYPENVYIVIGHLDDLPSYGTAPGADDNASGSVNVLESARVMSCYAFRNTLKFINCTGEESGLLGSEAYADDAALRGENILGVINMDMPGWAGNGSPDPENLDLNYNDASTDLGLRFAQAATTYGTGLAVDAFLCPSLSASDHYPFWTHGWKAVCGITDNEGYCGHSGNYPYYHTANDTIANCGNRSFFYSTVKTSVATLAELGQPFKIALGRPVYACGGTAVDVVVGDRDLNKSPAAIETVTVTIESGSETSAEQVVLTERSADSMIFEGSILTTSAPPVHGDGRLSVTPGDTITARYTDALDCNGATGVPYAATAGVDCVTPSISNVQALEVTGNSARITWTTDEASTSVVHYGTVPPGGSTASSPELVTAHSLRLAGLAECSVYSYFVESVDAAGNAAVDDNGGAYYTFETGKNVNPSYPSTGGPVTIPDNNPTGARSAITVSDNKTVLDVNVEVNITHTYDGDLELYLLAPNGTRIMLSNNRGSSGDNFRGTVFDDEAATPISSGSAPFSGPYRPDAPLSAADGVNAAGTWTLEVIDGGPSDVGTIDGWTLTLLFPAAQCGPHAMVTGHACVSDTCSAGGAGDDDGRWDAGEDVRFSVDVQNDGAGTLTGVSASITSVTPGVVMLDGAADYADLPQSASATSLAPHFAARLPGSLACGDTVEFQVVVASDQGSWPGAFTHVVGQPLVGPATPLNETFAAGIPAGWTIVDGGAGGGASATWTTANPCSRSISSPMAAPAAMVDSDCAGSGASQDEQLLTPVVDLSFSTAATLEFDEYFYWYSGGQSEVADVDVRSSITGGAWVNVLRQQGASSTNPAHKTVDITPQAAGAADAQVRFRYYNGSNEWYWEIDNVKLGTIDDAGCEMTTCPAQHAAPPPVPDGRFGQPMTVTRPGPGGSALDVRWDAETCPAPGYHLLWGPLSALPEYELGGSACDLGPSGTYRWGSVPAGNIWYAVVGDDGTATEGNWGESSSGVPWSGDNPSGQCGFTARDNSGSCGGQP